ncbi:DNA cross-link repair protein PSO2/SNM1 [Exophiala xenobiotica]|uniref:DNA cross-link repair protein PSO2/SNM1 n=1 Tax=Lithohypha guttulata TaxID=1690604 RepID=A0ABR0KAM7_9EURO|nr:DNA cross-link repair protein PSO2/SNM1 [Lithohypha guttulata]KAK5319204.1 DNA cross-link repair protein PSO2/SNM1 [Exophiala xenobiotica]
MFRNPRENVRRNNTEQVRPSTGRAPTPPPEGSMTPTQSPFFTKPATGSKMASTPASKMPVLGTIPQTKISTAKKSVVKQNQNIMSFFAKAEKKEVPQESPSKGEALFFDEGTPKKQTSSNDDLPVPLPKIPGWAGWSQEDTVMPSRFNESTTPVKRRRLQPEEPSPNNFIRTPSPERRPSSAVEDTVVQKADPPVAKPIKRRGGFVDDSSDDEGTLPDIPYRDGFLEKRSTDIVQDEEEQVAPTTSREPSYAEVTETGKVPLKPPDDQGIEDDSGPRRPRLSRQGTSTFQVDDFEAGDFDDEFFPEGEEFMERQYMEEQLAMERAFEDDSRSEAGTDGPRTPSTKEEVDELDDSAEAVAECPMCNGTMRGLLESEASAHVNACLDGSANPLPKASAMKAPQPEPISTTPPLGSKRFQRAAIARPGQANPFSLDRKIESKSAFSQLMSGHAEDRAWAEAAQNDVQSRGKAAYQRTCPFYKIMPGLLICVDAFRYGKVEGQNAYFLSHFHSDHYIGLTSQWCHGPIYASKITCNLMRQQLRVNPKWIVPLEFEKKVEVPNTNGVHVTMIPANHCPGSSLYLFEKVVGKNKDGSPRLNRILHCGDFRACPAHIHHPLLKPEVMDAVTGQTKNQTIDTCYLDTTYLTPKYSFPSQHDVIDACAQMCISLSKEIPDTGDAWEKAKLERAGSTMKKFLEAGADQDPQPAPEPLPGANHDDVDGQDIKPKSRGRLLVVIGTYSIGKERMCLGIARALNSKIYAPPPKMRICKALEDDELDSFLTSNPLEAQVHMQMLMEIRAETLYDYLVGFKPHFSRVVGFRPTGWSYRPPTSRFTENPSVATVLHSEGWKSRFTMRDLAPQRGSTRDSNCFGVPYSEHSSFRELTMFCCALRIGRVIPTVNVGSAKSREKMKGWIEKWEVDKRKNGLFRVEDFAEGWGSGDGKLRYGV